MIRRHDHQQAVSAKIFPGERQSDYAATESFLREARYDFAYLFMYSAREGTRAHKIPETVTDEEKRARLAGRFAAAIADEDEPHATSGAAL